MTADTVRTVEKGPASHQRLQALAAEMMEYSKSAFDDAIRTWEQLIGVRSLEQAMQIQSDYAKRVYENHMAEMKKLGEMTVGMVRDASKPSAPIAPTRRWFRGSKPTK